MSALDDSLEPADPPPPRPGGGVLGLLDSVLDAFAQILFAAMLAITLAQVALRYAFEIPAVWTEELARVLFVTAMLAGCAYAQRAREHIAVDFLLVRLRPRPRAAVDAIYLGAILLFLALWARGAWSLAEVNWNARYVTLPWLRVGHIYAFEVATVALCAMFVALQIAQSAARAMRGSAE
jgi:TRAP-type C4-dicarboxylate transport system permease small subunit